MALRVSDTKYKKTGTKSIATTFGCKLLMFRNVEGHTPVAAIFKLLRWFSPILKNFKHFSIFQFFQIFSFFQKFLKKSENQKCFFSKFLNLEIFCCRPMKNVGKLAVLLLLSKFSANFFLYFLQFPGTKSGENELLCCFLQSLALIFSNFTFFSFFRNF